MNSFGDRLKEERERLGLSQEAFGAIGGVQKLAQRNYEKGNRNPDASYVAAIAMAGVDALYLLTGQRTAATPALKPDEAALLDNYRHAPKEQQEILRATSAAFANKPTTTKASKDVKIGGKGHRFALGDYHENK